MVDLVNRSPRRLIRGSGILRLIVPFTSRAGANVLFALRRVTFTIIYVIFVNVIRCTRELGLVCSLCGVSTLGIVQVEWMQLIDSIARSSARKL